MSDNIAKEAPETIREEGQLPGGQPPFWIILSVIFFFVFGAGMLVLLILHVPAPEGLTAEQFTVFVNRNGRHVFLFIMGMMISCGLLGGSLYDIRGLIKHSAHNDYKRTYDLSYLLRPVAGSLCGLIALFLLMAGQLGMSPGDKGLASTGWVTFEGRLLYLTFGFLAGYASQVFMAKLKDIADAAFSTATPETKKEKKKSSETDGGERNPH
jgi:hypothetical protein